MSQDHDTLFDADIRSAFDGNKTVANVLAYENQLGRVKIIISSGNNWDCAEITAYELPLVIKSLQHLQRELNQGLGL